MEYDTEKVDQTVLALLSLTLHDVDEFGGRAWKGHDWDVLDRLHEKGWIGDPVSKAKSVVLPPESIEESRRLFDQFFGTDATNADERESTEAGDGFVGTWHIYEMEMWDEDYFNMEVQAYVEVRSDHLGNFQFGLVTGSLDGYIEREVGDEKFAFTWEGRGEMDPVSGSGWMKLNGENEVEGLINTHKGDRSSFKAKRAS
ncbi:MAG: DUF6429 family protein [Longimonas sp.]|uniref:DUF6429 family protein n=1 Tax=Longimonas sp. TaxID=2039626 RepID=UPI0039770F00